MSKLLFDEQPLVIDRTLARAIGLNEAIVLQQVHYWITINKKANKNFHEGKYWTYNSLPNWHKNNFDFWSFDTVKRTFSKLVKAKILITDNFNKDKRDRTLWYTIDYEVLETLINSIGAECTDGEGQNAPMKEGKMHRPLPETTTETTSDNNNNTIDAKKPSEKESHSVKETKTDVVVVDEQVERVAKELKPQIERTVGKITLEQLTKLIQTAGVDAVTKQLENYPKFKEVQNILNPVGFFISAVLGDWQVPESSTPNKQNSFNTFEQHEYTDEFLKSLFEPIGR